MTNTNNTTNNEFGINRLYVKDLSLEAPNVPQIFQGEWNPNIELNLDVQHSSVSDDFYEVVLFARLTAKIKEQVAFIIEVKQAGIFTIKGFDGIQKEQVLEIFCPNVLFPYLRNVVSETLVSASFPVVYLSPVNFEAIFMEKQKKQNERENKNN